MKSVLPLSASIFLALSPYSHSSEVMSLFVKPIETVSTPKSLALSNNGKQRAEKLVGMGKYNFAIGKNVESQPSIELNFNNKKSMLEISDTQIKGKDRISYSASNKDKSVVFHAAQINGSVVGSLTANGKLYKLKPAGDGNTMIVEMNNNRLIDHDSSYIEEYHEDYLTSDELTDSVDNLDSDAVTTIDVIVAYTSGFASAAGPRASAIAAYMDLLEQETNTSYSNSNVNARVNIVHYYQTSYRDSNDFYADRNYFLNTNNPAAAELDNKRDQYKADIKIVLTGNGYGFCGLASAIGANADRALGFASETCATGYYSFGHELGHLFGARHIITQDSNSTPYAFGHGYCNTSSNTWRTVMAYNCPSRTGGPRIQQWSNPDVLLRGQPTGTESTENNARVLNIRAKTMASFR